MIDTLCLDTLALMHALLRHGWSQVSLARDTTGRDTDPLSPQARYWCVDGARQLALATVCRDVPRPLAQQVKLAVNLLLRDATPEGYGANVYRFQWFNDDAADKRPVLRLIERAAARIGKG